MFTAMKMKSEVSFSSEQETAYSENSSLQPEQFGTSIETQSIPGQNKVVNLTNSKVDAI